MSALQGALLRSWTRRGPLAWALWPLSLIFRTLVAMRRQFYQWGWLHSAQVDAMVIVVGNVVAGGAGKTPTVIALVRHLQAQGLQVGVVSRGYGRSSQECLEVLSNSLPQDVGDEPLLVQRATGVPVFVADTRHAAASVLLVRHPQTQILVCDDGLQHYALYRNLEICVFDDRGTGNGFALPAGPLREPWPRTQVARVGQADNRLLVLHTGKHPAFAGHTAQRSLAPHAVRRDGNTVPWSALQAADAKPLLALAGIAQPESFFAMLRAGGLTLAHTLALPDHYDFDSLSRTSHEGYQLICTEKDAMKLWQHVPDALAIPLVQTMDATFLTALDNAVAAHLAAKLSSPHGHTTS